MTRPDRSLIFIFCCFVFFITGHHRKSTKSIIRMLHLSDSYVYLRDMENISVLTDFPESEPRKYYKKIASPFSGQYTVYTGGNFVYFSNTKNRTVRFSSKEWHEQEVSETQVNGWLERIHTLFPHF